MYYESELLDHYNYIMKDFGSINSMLNNPPFNREPLVPTHIDHALDSLRYQIAESAGIPRRSLRPQVEPEDPVDTNTRFMGFKIFTSKLLKEGESYVMKDNAMVVNELDRMKILDQLGEGYGSKDPE